MKDLSATGPINMMTSSFNGYLLNPIILSIIFLSILFIFIFKFATLGSGDTDGYNKTTKILAIVICAILISLLGANAFQYFFGIDVSTYVTGLFTPTPKVEVVVDQSGAVNNSIPEIKIKKQVFNIPGNFYDYENANAICQAYGADLASYEQIEKAYNNGAEWCNYGWSANQLALFPTQAQTYNTLQTIPGHENDCGRPGVNGGYIANPKVKFGVNCYGYKPKINKEEDELMKTQPPYPVTIQEMEMQKRIDFWKKRVDEILVSPFNHNVWSVI